VSQQRDALVLAEHRKQELADLLVHDLKSPITGILTNVSFALTSSALPTESWEALHDAVSAAESMLRMVMNLLDISRSEDGCLRANLADVDLLALIEQVRAGMEPRAKLESRQLEVEPSAGRVLLLADGDLLRRVLENLLDNCLKYAPRGSPVRIGVERADGVLRIRVKDQGSGIPPAERTRIFDKYAQLGASAPARMSRGLGLTFCKHATEAHGGRIWVENNHPTGSVFVVELPTPSDRKAAAVAPSAESSRWAMDT